MTRHALALWTVLVVAACASVPRVESTPEPAAPAPLASPVTEDDEFLVDVLDRCETDEECLESGFKWCTDGECEGVLREWTYCDEERSCEEGYHCVLDHDPSNYEEMVYLCRPDDDTDEE
jgi:hypothetical protein